MAQQLERLEKNLDGAREDEEMIKASLGTLLMRLEHKGTLMPPPKSSQLSPPRASQHYGAGADPHLAGVTSGRSACTAPAEPTWFDARIERRGNVCGAGNAAGPRRVECVRQRDIRVLVT